jgi:hypothetical protein
MTIHPGHGKTPKHVYAYRFLAGKHMNGARHTNSTFIHRATRDLTDHGHASAWAHLPGYHRSAWRIGVSAVVLATLYGYFTDRAVTVDSVLAALTALAVTGIIRARFMFANARHHRRVVRPLYQTMTLITSASTVHPHAHGDNHKRFIKVPRNYRHPKARIRLTVPETWEGTPAHVGRLNDLISRRLGGDWDAMVHLHEFPPFIEFVPSPSPPDKLTFAEMRAIMDAGRENQIIVGKGTHDSVISIDLDSESPHVALSMGTGGGKSATLRLFIAYLIHHGVRRIDIIDPKRVSHNWAKGIPGVHIHRTMAEQMTAVSEFRKRMESRYEELDHHENRVFPREVLIIEEQNSWMNYAKTYWADYRSGLSSNERGRTSATNPAIGDLAYCLFQGRQARMNIISVYQRMSASASGGGDMRENYGCRLLARYSPQTWTILVGTRPIPRSSRIPGRGRFVLGDIDREIQFTFITEAEAKAYALAGVPAVADDPLMTVPADGAGADDIPAMTLRELCDANIIPMRYSTATRARTRAGDTFPVGKPSAIGRVYNPSDVQAYFAKRGR